MSRRHSSRPRLVNALDERYRSVPMVVPPPESTMLPEFATDLMDEKFAVDLGDAEPREPGTFLFAPGVDPWPEIRRRLTVRQYEIFEYVYRLQMSVNDVMEVTGLQRKAVHRVLGAAKRKLRKSATKKKAK